MPRGSAWSRFLLAGALLGALEVGLVLATERAMFLSGRELARYAAFALGVWPLVIALLGAGGAAALGLLGTSRLARRGGSIDREALRVRVQRAVMLLAWPLLSWAAWLLCCARATIRVRRAVGARC